MFLKTGLIISNMQPILKQWPTLHTGIWCIYVELKETAILYFDLGKLVLRWKEITLLCSHYLSVLVLLRQKDKYFHRLPQTFNLWKSRLVTMPPFPNTLDNKKSLTSDISWRWSVNMNPVCSFVLLGFLNFFKKSLFKL